MAKITLRCPVRGVLKPPSRRSAGSLTPREEHYRVNAIRHLVQLGYPVANFVIEPIVKQFGHGGRNQFRSDFAVLDIGRSRLSDLDEILDHTVLLCEVKRDNSSADYVRETQVKPMLDFTARNECIGLYWDNMEQRVFWREFPNKMREWHEGPLHFLPRFGDAPESTPLQWGIRIR